LLTSKQVEARPAPSAARKILNALPYWVTGVLLLVAVLNFIGGLMGELPENLDRIVDTLSNFSAVFLGIFIEAAPFLLLGTLASGFVEVFVDREEMARWIPRNPLLGALAGSSIGMFFPVCECGVVPFTRRLIYKGVPVSVGISTLLAAPVINPIVIASTLAAFGPGMIFWGRMGLSLAIAVLVGLVFSLSANPRSMLRREDAFPAPALIDIDPTGDPKPPAPPKPPLKQRLTQVFMVAADEFFEMGRYLIIGALLASLMQTFVRQSALLEVGQGPVLSVLVLTALGVLLSICSTVDAFIALAFAGTFTSGSILAFLVYGPMVDIKSTLLYLRVFKTRTVVYLVLLPFMMTLISTVFINYFARGW
jgi:uncharacterized protein